MPSATTTYGRHLSHRTKLVRQPPARPIPGEQVLRSAHLRRREGVITAAPRAARRPAPAPPSRMHACASAAIARYWQGFASKELGGVHHRPNRHPLGGSVEEDESGGCAKLGPGRRWVEAVSASLRRQFDLEAHGGCTLAIA